MERVFLSATVHLINISAIRTRFQRDILGRVTLDGFRLPRQVHSLAFSRVSTGRRGYKYDNTRGASGSERNNPFRSVSSSLPLPIASFALRCSPSCLSRGSYPYRPSCITRRLLSPLYDIGNPKTRIKVPPPLRRRRDIHYRVASRDVAVNLICIRRSRREVKDACKSIGAIVP